jgi:CrcB protein
VSQLLNVALVGAGGAVGAACRYGLTLRLAQSGPLLLTGTLVTNALGCLIAGMALQYILLAPHDHPWLQGPGQLLFITGFCGAFTTMSAFVIEANGLQAASGAGASAGYIALTAALAFGSFYAGMLAVRMVIRLFG